MASLTEEQVREKLGEVHYPGFTLDFEHDFALAGVTALFGPSGDQEWGPWMVPSHTLISDISCRPCGMDGCGGGKISDCLEHIRPEDALEAIEDLIAS